MTFFFPALNETLRLTFSLARKLIFFRRGINERPAIELKACRLRVSCGGGPARIHCPGGVDFVSGENRELLSPLFCSRPTDENVPVGGLDLKRLTLLNVEGLADGFGNGDPQAISH